MKKEDKIEMAGAVVKALGNATFRVQIDGAHEITAYISGKIRRHYIKILPGDRVKIELSPYDLTKGRIIYREDARRRNAP